MNLSHDDTISAKKSRVLDERGLAALFLEARTARAFLPEPIPKELLERLIALTELAPTSANQSPARFVFVQSPEAKEKLFTSLVPGNVEKSRQAPVVAIIATDMEFHEHLPRLFPHAPNFKTMFDGEEKQAFRRVSAFRNGTLQGAYFMLAARALGLDIGPVSGFDNAKIDELFFAGTTYESNWIVNLGYGDDTKLDPRLPRFDFADVATIV